jgi:hypothetical protein
MKAVNNCKQIILSLKQYAKDADSAYPDGRHPELKSANQVFRVLFKDDIVVDERIFAALKAWLSRTMTLVPRPNLKKR